MAIVLNRGCKQLIPLKQHSLITGCRKYIGNSPGRSIEILLPPEWLGLGADFYTYQDLEATGDLPSNQRTQDLSVNANHPIDYSGQGYVFDGVANAIVFTKFAPPGLKRTVAFTINIASGVAGTIFNAAAHFYKLQTHITLGMRMYATTWITLSNDPSLFDAPVRVVFIHNDNNQVYLYANGVLVAGPIAADSKDIKANTNFGIMSNQLGDTEYEAGTLYDFEWWNEIWSAEDVAYDYANPEKTVLGRAGTTLTANNLMLKPILNIPSINNQLIGIGPKVFNFPDNGLPAWDTSGWSKVGDFQITANALASVLNPGNYLSYFYSSGPASEESATSPIATLSADNDDIELTFNIKKGIYTNQFDIENGLNGAQGRWRINPTLLPDEEIVLTENHPAVSITSPFQVHGTDCTIKMREFSTTPVDCYMGNFNLAIKNHTSKLDVSSAPTFTENLSGTGIPLYNRAPHSRYHVFDGTDDTIEFGNYGSHTSDFTVLYYGMVTNELGRLIAKRTTSGTYDLYWNATSRKLTLYDSSGFPTGQTDGIDLDIRPMLVGFAVDASKNVSFIEDAIKLDSVSTGVFAASTENLCIGSLNDSSGFANGLCMFAAIFDSEFSQDDIDELWNNGLPIFPSAHSKWNANCLEAVNDGKNWLIQGETDTCTINGTPNSIMIPELA